MDTLEGVRALDRGGYKGTLNTDHDAALEGDSPYRNAARAFSVGYIRALLSVPKPRRSRISPARATVRPVLPGLRWRVCVLGFTGSAWDVSL